MPFSSNDRAPILDLLEMYNGSMNIRKELDQIVRDAGYGDLSSIAYQTCRGFNYFRQGQQQVHTNRDHMGYTFFTRPILNLTYDNLSAVPTMAALRNAPSVSYQRMVRAYLDPWQQQGRYNNVPDVRERMQYTGNNPDDIHRGAALNDTDSPLVNPHNPFIPLLSNTLSSLSGWKDIALNDYTSKAGINNEQWSKVDGFFYKTEAFELSSSFKNIEGSPVMSLIHHWMEYMANCLEGRMNPYPVFIAEREYDYNTRIYRFIMDHTKTYITQWASTIAWPSSLSYGNQFNFDASKTFIDMNGEVSVTWKCIGADINDPIMPYEFNQLVEYYCPDLAIDYTKYDKRTESMVVQGNNYRKLHGDEKMRGLYLAIPLVNYLTYELEWWISKHDYDVYVASNKYTKARNEFNRAKSVRTGKEYSMRTNLAI